MAAPGARSFDPIDTDHLRSRALVADDAPALAAYRSDPDVARDQSWAGALAGPTVDEWYQIGIDARGDLVGDVAADAAVPEERDGQPLLPWYRAVAADGVLGGLVMLAMPIDHDPRWFLWRLLVDARHRGRGVGRRIVALLAEQVRSGGGTELHTSWAPGDSSPVGFYRRLGFLSTGAIDDGEVVAVLPLAAP